MKSIFDKQTRDALINRINLLDDSSSAQWGKMNIYQMIKHCILWEEMVLNNVTYKRVFIGRMFGKMTKEQIGLMAYKHIDHHLRQFNV